MTRLTLQTKEEKYKIKRLATKEDHSYIPSNNPANFNLLKDNRYENEKFTRVDKFIVNHYYLIGTEWLSETIFYPSELGIKELNEKEFDWENDHSYKSYYEKLIKTGIGLLGTRSTANIKKPVKRLKLECRPKRMNLICNE